MIFTESVKRWTPILFVFSIQTGIKPFVRIGMLTGVIVSFTPVIEANYIPELLLTQDV